MASSQRHESSHESEHGQDHERPHIQEYTRELADKDEHDHELVDFQSKTMMNRKITTMELLMDNDGAPKSQTVVLFESMTR